MLSKVMRPLVILVAAVLIRMSAAEDSTAKAILSDADVLEFHNSVDLDGDKHVTVSEMMEFAKPSAKHAVLKEFLMRGVPDIMEILDTDMSGSVTLEEYRVALETAEAKDAQDVKSESEMFHAADTSGDGVLNQEELAHAFLKETLEIALMHADKNFDQKLSYNEMTADLVMAQVSAQPDEDPSEEWPDDDEF